MAKFPICFKGMQDSYAIALLAIHMSCDSCKKLSKCFIFQDGPSMFSKTKICVRIHTLFLNNMKSFFYFFFCWRRHNRDCILLLYPSEFSLIYLNSYKVLNVYHAFKESISIILLYNVLLSFVMICNMIYLYKLYSKTLWAMKIPYILRIFK